MTITIPDRGNYCPDDLLFFLVAVGFRWLVQNRLLTVISQDFTWDEIVNWFRFRKKWKSANPDIVGFSVLQFQAAHYQTMQGMFDARTKEIVDCRFVASQKIDSKLAHIHCKNPIVIYQ